ncbi:MAG: hypothetical protein BroJett007_31140 [Chloroflexota bacterium]|nr:MAG: hypothetical protein BroJett007_31140 [Chloroflexota bacterium]
MHGPYDLPIPYCDEHFAQLDGFGQRRTQYESQFDAVTVKERLYAVDVSFPSGPNSSACH